MRKFKTYFGISSLPGRWREGGLKVAVGWVVLLGNVFTGGGCHWLGRSLSGGVEDAEDDREWGWGWLLAGAEDDGDDEADMDTTSGVLIVEATGLLSILLMGTILSLCDVWNNNGLFKTSVFAVKSFVDVTLLMLFFCPLLRVSVFERMSLSWYWIN